MSWPPAMAARSPARELMESPGREVALTLRTYAQFARINRLLSRSRTILRRWVLEDIARDPTRTYHLADLGAGGLDIARWLARAARARGLRVRITAVENDPDLTVHLRQHPALTAGVDLVVEDLFSWLRAGHRPDYIFCNHVLHHLSDPLATELLVLLGQSARRRFLVSDLRRSRWSYVGFTLFGHLLLPRSYALPDGLTSIQRGFRPAELQHLVRAAGLHQRATVHTLVPGRLLVVGDAPPGALC